MIYMCVCINFAKMEVLLVLIQNIYKYKVFEKYATFLKNRLLFLKIGCFFEIYIHMYIDRYMSIN